MKRHQRALLLASLFIAVCTAQAAAPALPDAVIADSAGRRIVVSKPFRRIISLYGAHTENLFFLGLDEQIIGVSRHEAYPPRARRKPSFSYHDDPEKFLAARPDLILIRPMIDRGYPQLIARLEAHGITVVSLQPRTVAEMYAYWQALGTLTGTADRAREMIATFKAAARRLKELSAAIADKKRVYFEAIHSKMKTFAPDSMAMFALETAGGCNVASDAVPVRDSNIADYGKERILSHARDIDVYLAQHGAMNRPSIELIAGETGFHIIKAVREKQVYLIDEMIVSRPTMRLLQGICRIGTALYAARFSAADKILKQAGITLPEHRRQRPQ